MFMKLIVPQFQHKEIFSKTHHNKTIKIKEKDILKAAREKKLVNYKGNPIRLSMNFSVGIIYDSNEWDSIFKIQKEKNDIEVYSILQSYP